MSARDTFPFATSPNDPADDVIAVTPHDSNELPVVIRGVCFSSEGTLKIKTKNGSVVTFASGVLSPGIIHPIKIRQVYATDTTVTNIYGVV